MARKAQAKSGDRLHSEKGKTADGTAEIPIGLVLEKWNDLSPRIVRLCRQFGEMINPEGTKPLSKATPNVETVWRALHEDHQGAQRIKQIGTSCRLLDLEPLLEFRRRQDGKRYAESVVTRWPPEIADTTPWRARAERCYSYVVTADGGASFQQDLLKEAAKQLPKVLDAWISFFEQPRAFIEEMAYTPEPPGNLEEAAVGFLAHLHVLMEYIKQAAKERLARTAEDESEFRVWQEFQREELLSRLEEFCEDGDDFARRVGLENWDSSFVHRAVRQLQELARQIIAPDTELSALPESIRATEEQIAQAKDATNASIDRWQGRQQEKRLRQECTQSHELQPTTSETTVTPAAFPNREESESGHKQLRLTAKQRAVYEILAALPPNEGLSEKQIADRLRERKIETAAGSIRNSIILRLREKGIKIVNVPGFGYFIEQ